MSDTRYELEQELARSRKLNNEQMIAAIEEARERARLECELASLTKDFDQLTLQDLSHQQQLAAAKSRADDAERIVRELVDYHGVTPDLIDHAKFVELMRLYEGEKARAEQLRKDNLRLKTHLILQSDALKSPHDLYDVVRKEDVAELTKLRGFYDEIVRAIGHDRVLAELQDLNEDARELQEENQKAIDILDGNAPPIDWRAGGPELLRKLSEHLEHSAR